MRGGRCFPGFSRSALGELLQDRFGDFLRAAVPADVGGAHLALRQHSGDGGFQLAGGVAHAKMVEHHAGAQDGGQRIDHALAGDIGRGPVDRFELEGKRRSGSRLALAARPMLPTRMAEMSLRISANRLEPTTTSKLSGRRMKFMAAASTSSDSVSTCGYSAAISSKQRSHSTML